MFILKDGAKLNFDKILVSDLAWPLWFKMVFCVNNADCIINPFTQTEAQESNQEV